MFTRRVLFLSVALMIALGTAFAVRHWVASERAAAFASVPKQTVRPVNRVLVAKAELVPGSFVKADSLKWQPWPDDGLLDAYMVQGPKAKKSGKSADFTGAVVRNRVLPGQPITRMSVVQPGDRGFMAAVLTPGMRAVSVPVNATSGIAGFVFPGDKVDVILTLLLPSSGKIKKRASQTLFEDVRVLAMDQVVENADGKAAIAKTSTLEVSPKQAEKMALALQMGGLSLSLRSLSSEQDATHDSASAKVTADRFTLDRDILFMRKRSASQGDGKIVVLRGIKAETAKF